MNKIVLCGFEKTGTTWACFIATNYFNILNFNANKSLKWGNVLKIVGGTPKKVIEKTNEIYTFKDGVANVYYTHTPVYNSPETKKFFKQFDKIVYTYRNPFDTMISTYYYIIVKGNHEILHNIENVGGLRNFKDFDNFIKFGTRLDEYIDHVKYNKPRADLVLDYDKLRRDRSDFRKYIGFLTDNIDETVFQKALKLSSFENIRRMEIKNHKDDNIKSKSLYLEPIQRPMKTRDGRSGQYKEVMNEEIFNHINEKWIKAGLKL